MGLQPTVADGALSTTYDLVTVLADQLFYVRDIKVNLINSL